MAPRPAYVHPSGLSPAEHDTYAAWTDELDSQISKLGRGLRFGEMLAFIRKRTPVDREAEIMSFFGSIPQQQSLGVGEFIAILRLLAHARTCATLTRDHIFIQTHPLVITIPVPAHPPNPFLKAPSNGISVERLEGPSSVNLREAASKKKRLLPPSAPSIASTSNGAVSTSPITPKASSLNPFRMQPTPESPVEELRESRKGSILPPTPPESSATAKSPPLPPRPSSMPKQPPPKHISQLYKRIDDGTQTPTLIKPLHVPAKGPTSLDIISSSLQPDHTGQSAASSTERRLSNSPGKTSAPTIGPRKGAERESSTVRLLGSSHIGVDAKPLRAKPPPRHSSSSEDFTLHKNASDSSLSSLAGMLPRGRRETQSSAAASTVHTDSRSYRSVIPREEDESGTFAGSDVALAASTNQEGQTTLKGLAVKSTPPMPPPPRRRPESLYVATNATSKAQKLVFGTTPSTGHPAPYSATSIQSSPAKQRTNSLPYISHGRAASMAGSAYSQPTAGLRQSEKGSSGLTRATSVSHRPAPLDSIISRGRGVSHEWLEKARAGMLGGTRDDRHSLIAADEVAYTAKTAEEDGNNSEDSETADVQHRSVQDRRRELERIRTEEEPGWARLD